MGIRDLLVNLVLIKFISVKLIPCIPRIQSVYVTYTLFHNFFSTFFINKISLPERRNKRKSVLEIIKMYYF